MQIFFKNNYYLSDVFMWSLKLGEISSLDGWIFTEELYRVKLTAEINEGQCRIAGVDVRTEKLLVIGIDLVETSDFRIVAIDSS